MNMNKWIKQNHRYSNLLKYLCFVIVGLQCPYFSPRATSKGSLTSPWAPSQPADESSGLAFGSTRRLRLPVSKLKIL